ncbi:MAG: pyridoxal phosphate-dependent aminotransferase [Oscillospiraceae bacterium]|nr:pyridoxal phosphate-dependent aminotransferase [Oscillospiraceae bacterium]
MKKSLSRIASNVKASSTITIDALFKKMKAEGQDVIGFGTGEPDFNTPDHIKQAGIDAIGKNQTRYTPAAGTLELRQAICDAAKKDYGLKYAPTQVVVSCGAKHTISQLMMILCNPGDEVILPSPYWVSYPEMISMAGAVPVVVEGLEENGFLITPEQLAKAITPKTKAVIFNSPSNPTGMIYKREDLKALCDICVKEGIYIVSDEVYDKLVYDGISFTSIPALGEEIKELAILVNAVSKTYCMTGWRIGWACANAEIAKIMSAYQSHSASAPASMSQAAALEAIKGDQSGIEKMRKEFEGRRDFFVKRVSEIEGISCCKPEGAFYIMLNVNALMGRTISGRAINSSDAFAETLLEKQGVAVVPCEGFGSPGYVRMSYAASMENISKGLDRIEAFIKG